MKKVALVGKGLTFDSGGYNIKVRPLPEKIGGGKGAGAGLRHVSDGHGFAVELARGGPGAEAVRGARAVCSTPPVAPSFICVLRPRPHRAFDVAEAALSWPH